MQSKYDKQQAARAVELGNSNNGNVLPELIVMLRSNTVNVRRLAVSAIGKLVGFVDQEKAVSALLPILHDKHPQVKQYGIKALKCYGANAAGALHDLKDISQSDAEKEYNRVTAEAAIDAITEAVRIREKQAVHYCQRCGIEVKHEEFAKSQAAFQRPFCDKCFDEVFLERRNFDTRVELNKEIRTSNGTLVQSKGEKKISNWLFERNIEFRYDERFRIVEGYAIRPDFYLPEADVYIEYWGMDTTDYKIGMLKKKKLYQQQGKKLISVSFKDYSNLENILERKVARYINIPAASEKQLIFDTADISEDAEVSCMFELMGGYKSMLCWLENIPDNDIPDSERLSKTVKFIDGIKKCLDKEGRLSAIFADIIAGKTGYEAAVWLLWNLSHECKLKHIQAVSCFLWYLRVNDLISLEARDMTDCDVLAAVILFVTAKSTTLGKCAVAVDMLNG